MLNSGVIPFCATLYFPPVLAYETQLKIYTQCYPMYVALLLVKDPQAYFTSTIPFPLGFTVFSVNFPWRLKYTPATTVAIIAARTSNPRIAPIIAPAMHPAPQASDFGGIAA